MSLLEEQDSSASVGRSSFIQFTIEIIDVSLTKPKDTFSDVELIKDSGVTLTVSCMLHDAVMKMVVSKIRKRFISLIN